MIEHALATALYVTTTYARPRGYVCGLLDIGEFRKASESVDALVQSLVIAGLTLREAQVASLVAVGRSNQHVAELLTISD